MSIHHVLSIYCSYFCIILSLKLIYLSNDNCKICISVICMIQMTIVNMILINTPTYGFGWNSVWDRKNIMELNVETIEVCLHDNSSSVQVRICKFGPEVPNTHYYGSYGVSIVSTTASLYLWFIVWLTVFCWLYISPLVDQLFSLTERTGLFVALLSCSASKPFIIPTNTSAQW